MGVEASIITCPQWRALDPRNGLDSIIWTPRAAKQIIFHHTAGHHAEIENPADESVMESVRYARDIQHFHMGPERGWNDSGHNFLVCRNGVILQGRWRTVRAIQAKRMVVSAHCPGQNNQIGIEHEHDGTELMTPAQKEASARLQAWIADRYDLAAVLPVYPHKRFFSTDCPANLITQIDPIRRRAQQILDASRL